jgi:hypothetical protein
VKPAIQEFRGEGASLGGGGKPYKANHVPRPAAPEVGRQVARKGQKKARRLKNESCRAVSPLGCSLPAAVIIFAVAGGYAERPSGTSPIRQAALRSAASHDFDFLLWEQSG